MLWLVTAFETLLYTGLMKVLLNDGQKRGRSSNLSLEDLPHTGRKRKLTAAAA